MKPFTTKMLAGGDLIDKYRRAIHEIVLNTHAPASINIPEMQREVAGAGPQIAAAIEKGISEFVTAATRGRGPAGLPPATKDSLDFLRTAAEFAREGKYASQTSTGQREDGLYFLRTTHDPNHPEYTTMDFGYTILVHLGKEYRTLDIARKIKEAHPVTAADTLVEATKNLGEISRRMEAIRREEEVFKRDNEGRYVADAPWSGRLARGGSREGRS